MLYVASTANSGSVVNSDSKNNSPGTTAMSIPVGPRTMTAVSTSNLVHCNIRDETPCLNQDDTVNYGGSSSATTTTPMPKLDFRSTNIDQLPVHRASTECIDNTGSDND